MRNSPSLWRTLAELGPPSHRYAPQYVLTPPFRCACCSSVVILLQKALRMIAEWRPLRLAGAAGAAASQQHNVHQQVWQRCARQQPAHQVRPLPVLQLLLSTAGAFVHCNRTMVRREARLTGGSLRWQVCADRRRALCQAAAVPGERGDLVPQALRPAVCGARQAPARHCCTAKVHSGPAAGYVGTGSSARLEELYKGWPGQAEKPPEHEWATALSLTT